MSGIDAYNLTRNLIENAFSHLTWHEAVCTETGFKGISQVWKVDPAWYFWMEQVEGAFLLRLHADEPLGDKHYVSLSLHYFPAADDEFYQRLSAGEKWLLSDKSVFDQKTNTPHFEAYEQFTSLFVVAEIGCVLDADGLLQVLLYSSEKGEGHPFNGFIDLLITALNFQSKRHHQDAYALQEGSVTTCLLSYSEAAFKEFLAEFDLDSESLLKNVSDHKLTTWLHAAHLDAVCSVNGACSCSH
jgi:hypothetical protein